MSPPTVNLNEVESHYATRSRVRACETFVNMLHVPLLACLSLYFCILKWTLKNCSERPRHNSSSNCSQLKTTSKGNGVSHELIALPPGVKQFKSREASRPEHNRAYSCRQSTSIQWEESICFQDFAKGLNKANFLAHVLTLGLHLSLDSIKRVSNYCISSTKQSTSECRYQSFFPPTCSLLSVWHSQISLCLFVYWFNM